MSGPDQFERPQHLEAGKPAEAGDFLLERRYRLVKRRARLAGEHLLDFGCGNGEQTLLFAADFPAVTGIDISRTSLEAFRLRIGALGLAERLTALEYGGDELPLPSESMDAVVSFEVLEHVADDLGALHELWRILRPGGRLALTVPNRWWVFETHGACLPALPWNRVPFFSWLPRRLHDRWARARIYRRREIVGLVRQAGFRIDGSAYVTAPLDVVKWRPLRDFLRATFFRGDTTILPWMATAVLVIAEKPALADQAIDAT